AIVAFDSLLFVRRRFLRGELELAREFRRTLERRERSETPHTVEIPPVARRRARLRKRQVGGARSLNDEEQSKHAHARSLHLGTLNQMLDIATARQISTRRTSDIRGRCFRRAPTPTASASRRRDPASSRVPPRG